MNSSNQSTKSLAKSEILLLK